MPFQYKDFDSYTFNYDAESGVLKCWNKRCKWYLEGCVGSRGYLIYCLRKNGVKKYVNQHRIITTEFLPNPENKPCVDHIDRNRQNNKLSNLRWSTYSENSRNVPKCDDPKWYYWNTKQNRFQVRYKRKHHGYFKTEEEAIARVNELKRNEP